VESFPPTLLSFFRATAVACAVPLKIFVYVGEETTQDELKHEIESAGTCEAVKVVVWTQKRPYSAVLEYAMF
jgi:hypothetical protein